MKLFKCQACGNILYFENRKCGQCGHQLAFMPERLELSAIEPIERGIWNPLAVSGQQRTFCANANYDACNWFLSPKSTEPFCAACRHNAVVPDLHKTTNLGAWQQLEFAKHRLFYSLLRWRLPLKTTLEDPSHGLNFEFLADSEGVPGAKVLTGHDEGKIVIALIEADDAEREKRRQGMGEPYRTLLGHFRHEVGHHYWDILVRDGGPLNECRAVFGDDSQDYEEALKRHYKEGAPKDWQENFVSQYATTHPWEDFAETWAHYLHIVDTLDTVAASGMFVRPQMDMTGTHTASVKFDPYQAQGIQQLIDAWVPFVVAINSVSRAMGERDLYPFVVAPAVIHKLGFIHNLIHRV